MINVAIRFLYRTWLWLDAVLYMPVWSSQECEHIIKPMSQFADSPDLSTHRNRLIQSRLTTRWGCWMCSEAGFQTDTSKDQFFDVKATRATAKRDAPAKGIYGIRDSAKPTKGSIPHIWPASLFVFTLTSALTFVVAFVRQGLSHNEYKFATKRTRWSGNRRKECCRFAFYRKLSTAKGN